MTVFDDVKELVQSISPQCICDDCITQKLNLSVRQHANHKSRALAELADFNRANQICSICGAQKLSIGTV
ncbi:hypothetical protein HW561_02165 [Rhodobacteraceae bacterium B1Z28]|uniref:Uncharacterized protein n=1 Tax=Ruegeria haliotis TaxID=2747601 RepID=A0ABX2PLV9_9RHOB|nr:hypothetical protein [Ruegeria haliotis]NVO54592.1 hypothetical protein [Ruegeria haliotis]